MVIGDTVFDMGMARAAGATGIGAGWGYHDAAELLAGGALAVAEQPVESWPSSADGSDDRWMTKPLETAVPDFHLVRLVGLATFLGVAIAFSDLLRDGGWPIVGVPVAIIGLVDAVFSPRILKKRGSEERQ